MWITRRQYNAESKKLNARLDALTTAYDELFDFVAKEFGAHARGEWRGGTLCGSYVTSSPRRLMKTTIEEVVRSEPATNGRRKGSK
jgi:hypothetical protein